jgi:bifunctional ADP-heptose synthase (sugar kinase/adenylyltransferase)
MAALGCVALVTWFDEDTPLQRILDCQPEILVKGGDWPVEKIVGCTEVLRLGRHGAFDPVHSPEINHGAAGKNPQAVGGRIKKSG